MKKIILISSDHIQTRVALIENGRLCEFYTESHNGKRTFGNIYKGRVTKVLPGMQAAFVDIGVEKDTFLYVMDVIKTPEDLEQMIICCDEDENEEHECREAMAAQEHTPDPDEPDNNHPVQTRGLFMDAGSEAGKTTFDEIDEEADRSEAKNAAIAVQRRSGNMQTGDSVSIDELLQEGQEILVQVIREPVGTKGARVTSHVTLPGRYLVFMPTVTHIGVSKKIEDEETRKNLKSLILELKPPRGGFIVRTVAEEIDAGIFRKDIESLCKLWENILRKAEKTTAPAIIHRDLDPIFRSVRDLLSEDVEELILDSEHEYRRCVEYVETINPELTPLVKYHNKSAPLFELFGVDEEVDKALRSKVWLKSGGYIVIEQTEALTAIDVNTGKYVGKRNFEETITKTNMEAAVEIAHQLRLRDIGGIIIIDFIDMELEKDRKMVYEALETALKKDRSRTYLSDFTNLGLIEMTRKRIKKSLEKSLCTYCHYCRGAGMIKSPETISIEIQHDLTQKAQSVENKEILIKAHPEVVKVIKREYRDYISMLEMNYRKRVTIKSEDKLHQTHYEINTF